MYLLLNVIIGQASGELMKSALWFTECHTQGWDLIGTHCVCVRVCVCARETPFLLYCLGRIRCDQVSGPCERVSMSNRETGRVVNNQAHTPGNTTVSLLMLKAWNTFALTFSEKNKVKIGCVKSCKCPLKWVLYAVSLKSSVLQNSLPNEALLLSYVEMIASEKIFCARHVRIDQPRLVKQLSQSNFLPCCIHFKLPHWCHLGSSLVRRKNKLRAFYHVQLNDKWPFAAVE